MKKLQLRIILIFVLIFSILSVCIGTFSSKLLRDHAFSSQKEQLEENAILISSLLPLKSLESTQVQDLIAPLSELQQPNNQRVTLVSLDGTVIYDSKVIKDNLGNHGNRIEIKKVLEGAKIGTAERKSDSTNETLYYVGVPLNNQDGQLIGVLRLSKPINKMANVDQQIRLSLIMSIVFSLILGILLTSLTTKQIAKPIEEVMEVAEDLSNKLYHNRYHGKGYGEIAELGEVMNHLAESLEGQMYEIQQNEERINGLINHLVIGVMLLDEQRHIQIVNPAMSVMLGQDNSYLIGKSYVEVTKSYGLTHMIEKAYQKGIPQNEEIYFYYPKDRILDANIVPITGKHKGELNLIVLLYDITEIKKLEKIKTDFVTNASHELRTPVTALKGFSETLLDGAMDDKVILKQFLEIMYAESSRLDLLVNDILELSKLEQKQVPLEQELIEVQEAVHSSFRLVKHKADEKNMNLLLNDADPIYLLGDSGRLKQIITNLLTNAVSYTEAGGKVEVFVEQSETEATIKISDNGMGIPEAELDRIFERFYRVDKARSRNSGGTGLGLSIVKYLVENFNGTIQVESKLGLGTTFTIILPLK